MKGEAVRFMRASLSREKGKDLTQSIITICLNPATDRIIELPRFTPGEHIKGHLLARYPAGKAINVSRALAVLGHCSLLTGFVGREENDYYRKTLEKRSEGMIRCDLFPVESPTRENITLIDAARKTATHIRDDTFKVTQPEIASLENYLDQIDLQDKLLCFCGSLPQGMDQTDFERLIDTLVTRLARVVVDSSGPHLLALRKKKIWLVKPNLKELEELSATEILNENHICEVLATLCGEFGMVLASAEEKGAYLMADGRLWHGILGLRRETVLSTVGCGDCLLAGFLSGFQRGLETPEALKLGLACAAANAVSNTTVAFTREDVEHFARYAQVEPLQAG